jgi:hypothetical protein
VTSLLVRTHRNKWAIPSDIDPPSRGHGECAGSDPVETAVLAFPPAGMTGAQTRRLRPQNRLITSRIDCAISPLHRTGWAHAACFAVICVPTSRNRSGYRGPATLPCVRAWPARSSREAGGATTHRGIVKTGMLRPLPGERPSEQGAHNPRHGDTLTDRGQPLFLVSGMLGDGESGSPSPH